MAAGRKMAPPSPWRHFAIPVALIASAVALAAFGLASPGEFPGLRRLAVGIALIMACLGGLLLRLPRHGRALSPPRDPVRQLADLAGTIQEALIVFRRDPGGAARFPYASPATEELLGLKPDRLAKDAGAFFAAVHPEDRERVHTGLADPENRLSPWVDEFRIAHPKKGEVWIEVRATPRCEADGSLLWHGLAQDISKRRGSQQALQRADGRWSQLAEAMPQLAWICGDGGECLFLNRHWQDYTGHPASSQDGRAWLEAVHPEDMHRLISALDWAAPGGIDGEFRLRRADGEYRWFKTHAAPVQDKATGQLIWYGFNTDIQELKEFETALHRSLRRQQALQQLDRAILEARTPEEIADKGLAHLHSLLSCRSAAVLAVDREAGEGTVLAIRGLEAAGYAVGQRIGLTFFNGQDLALLKKGQIRIIGDLGTQAHRSPALESLYRQGIRSWLRIPLMVEHQLLGALSLGSERVGHFGKAEVRTARPIADVLAIALQQARLRQNQFLQTTTLETHVQERTAALERLKNQAEAANRAKSHFLANISQELQTPLNSLLILTEMLADNAQGNLTPEQREFARVIRNAGGDLLALVNDILDISKIEAGRAAVHGTDVRFEAMADYVERHFRQAAEGKGLRFDLALDGELPATLHIDFEHLKPILRNLMGNAIKFTASGSVGLRIYRASTGWTPGHPALSAASEAIAFEVADSGIGIPREKLAVIFDAFAQSEEGKTRRYGGTGLGLHIARANAELLGADLTVRSDPGKGSTFILYLPRIHAAPRGSARDGSPAP